MNDSKDTVHKYREAFKSDNYLKIMYYSATIDEFKAKHSELYFQIFSDNVEADTAPME